MEVLPTKREKKVQDTGSKEGPTRSTSPERNHAPEKKALRSVCENGVCSGSEGSAQGSRRVSWESREDCGAVKRVRL